VSFPYDPSKYNQNITVKVENVEPDQAERKGLSLSAVLLCLLSICLLVILLCYTLVKPRLIKRERQNREEDAVSLEKLKREDLEGFKKALGNRNILELRDRNYNNIFHRASKGSWNSVMTNALLQSDQDKTDEEAPLERKRTDIFHDLKPSSQISKWTRLCSDHIPYYLWPEKLNHCPPGFQKQKRGHSAHHCSRTAADRCSCSTDLCRC